MSETNAKKSGTAHQLNMILIGCVLYNWSRLDETRLEKYLIQFTFYHLQQLKQIVRRKNKRMDDYRWPAVKIMAMYIYILFAVYIPLLLVAVYCSQGT